MNEYERLTAKYPDAFEWLRTHRPEFHAQIRYGLSHPELAPHVAKQVEQGLAISDKELDDWATAAGHEWKWEE